MNSNSIVSVSHEGQLLRVQLTGKIRPGNFQSVFDEIRNLADASQVKCILIDARAFKEKVTVVQRMQVAMSLVDSFLGYRVAGVISSEAFDPRLLAETMARNRGGNVKMTTSLAEALKWLKSPGA